MAWARIWWSVRGRIFSIRRVEGTPEEMSDEALLAACSVGDKAALGALFDRFYDSVRRFLSRRAGTDERDLDDLVQMTFLAAPEAARRFDGRSSVRGWLLGIANNTARHHIRAEIRRKRVAGVAAAEPLASSQDASADLLAHERAQRLRLAVAALPEDLRETFVLVYFEGLGGKEVAALLDIREANVWKRLQLARTQLRDALGGE